MNYMMPERPENSNKGTFGKVLNVSGNKNYIGASYLSTASILRSGAGFAALSSHKENIKIVSTMLPEAVFMTRQEGLRKLDKFTVLLIGCGLGTDFGSKNLFINMIEKAKKINIPTIIDADGLNILAKYQKIELPDCIITPHPLEAARLLKIDLDIVLSDLEQSARNLSDKYNCVVVLKTHRTIICNKNSFFINQHGCSALAKAGSGDVLAGIISGLVAQKMDLYEAAKLGVYLHSRAGEIAAKTLSNYSVLASDLIDYLPKAISELV